MFDSNGINLGAPILGYSSVVSMDASESSSTTYTPVTINSPDNNSTNSNDPNVFNPNVNTITETQVTYKNKSV
jgi:hypothetical protein